MYLDATSITFLQVVGMPKPPLFVLPSGAGLGYGLFILDPASRDYLLQHIEAIADPLTRGSAWVTLWENMLESHVVSGRPSSMRRYARCPPRPTSKTSSASLNYTDTRVLAAS